MERAISSSALEVFKDGCSDLTNVDGCQLCAEEAALRTKGNAIRWCSCWSRSSAATWPAPAAARCSIRRISLKKQLTPEECFAAVEECGAPMVSIPGGEPLLHPQIVEIVNGLIARKKYIYLCTNALELKRRLPEFTPSKYLTFSVHLDGQREHHDFSVCREGGYDIAVEGIKEAVKRGFRVTTNATFFDGTDPNSVRAFFDEVMDMGVEGIVLSPGYSYDKAPDQNHFMGRARVRRLFRAILSNRKPIVEVQHVAAVP
jgi:hopanoid biosynthesis associated radical SAM protein HpnH